MGEMPGSRDSYGIGEAGDNLILTDITAIFRETRTRKAAVTKKSISVDYVPSGLMEVDLLNPKSQLHKKSTAGYGEAKSTAGYGEAKSTAGYGEANIKRNFTSVDGGDGCGVHGRIPGNIQTSVGRDDGRSVETSVGSRSLLDAENMAAMRIPGDIENRKGSLSLYDKRGSGSGRGRTNTMPSLSPTGKIQTSQDDNTMPPLQHTGKIQTSQDAKYIKEEQESQPVPDKTRIYQSSQSMVEPTELVPMKAHDFQSSQSMVEPTESVPMKAQGFQSSQSMVEIVESVPMKPQAGESISSTEIPTVQKTELDERTLSAPVIDTETKSKNRKLSEVLMSSWFFQRKSSDSETDLKSLADENNQEEDETKTLSPAKNNANHCHKDNDSSKKMSSLSNFVAGNFTARDLRSLNAFVPQST